MKLVRKPNASDIARDWRRQYPRGDKYTTDEQEQIAHDLAALPKNASTARVDKIIGNNSWTRGPECNECDDERNAVVRLGGDGYTAEVCARCLRRALALLERAK